MSSKSPSRINLSTSKSNYTLATFGDLKNTKQRKQYENFYYDSMKSVIESPSISAEVQSITSGLKSQKHQGHRKMRKLNLLEYGRSSSDSLGQDRSASKKSNFKPLRSLSKLRSRSPMRPKTAMFSSQKVRTV